MTTDHSTASLKTWFTLAIVALFAALAIVPACHASSAPATAQSESAQVMDAAPQADDAPAAPEAPAKVAKKGKRGRGAARVGHSSGNELVSIGHDSTLAVGEKADAVVSILGSSSSAGEVGDSVVSILGSSASSGEVANAVVSVLGDTQVTGGSVGDSAVAILGSVTVNGHVQHDVVAVFGNVVLGPDAVIDGDLVCVGGEVTQDPKAILRGKLQNVAIGGPVKLESLQVWIKECALYARLLAFNGHLLWAWAIALSLLGFYALIALVAPSGVARCAQTLEQRPGFTILTSVLVPLLSPVVVLLLCLTMALVIGFALLPIFLLGLFVAGIFGKAVMLAWVGRRVGGALGSGAPLHPAVSVLIGGAVVLLLYTVPIVGFITYKVLTIMAPGVVVYTLLLMIANHRKASAEAALAGAAPFGADAFPAAPFGSDAIAGAAPFVAGAVPPVPQAAASSPAPLFASPASPAGVDVAAAAPRPVAIASAALPRAGFWLRFLAAFLDLIMVGIVWGILGDILHWNKDNNGFLLVFPLYNVVLWATRGTTVGAVICGLRVVRLDGRPMDWGIAIVRCLGAFLSLFLLGLGFFWVVFDDQRQSWHDKIAGTTIVRMPKGASLV
jgi:uncharacterized RDD family membrane protein YckC